MNTAQFGQTIKQKYPQYNDLTDEEVGTRMLQKYPQYKDMVSIEPTGTDTNSLASVVKSIPVIGGLMGSAVNTAQDVGVGIRNIMEQPNLKKNEQMASEYEKQAMATRDMVQRKSLLQQANQIRGGISNETQNISRSFTEDINKSIPLRAVEGAVGIASTAELPFAIASLLKTGVKIPGAVSKYGTTGRTWKTMETAAKKGKDINWQTIVDKARSALKDNSKSYREALEKVLTDRAPVAGTTEAGNVGEKVISSVQALTKRKTLGNELQKDFLGNLRIPATNEEQVAKNVLRRVISEELKKAAPNIKTADDMYSFYSKIHGDLPTWAKRYVLGELLKHSPIAKIPIIGQILEQIPGP